MLSSTFLALAALSATASAHFQLLYPPSRGSGDDNQATFPCGGYAQSQNRTLISSTSFPISLDLGHTQSLISIFIAIGNEAGSNFNHQLQPTVQEQGPGDFCFPSVPVPTNLGITNGTNATIQVITDGHGGTGLYNCADVTFTTEAVTAGTCTNSTGLTATVASAGAVANGTSSGHSTSSSGAAAASSTSSQGAAPTMFAGLGAMGMAVLGAVAAM